jgi:protein MAK16
LCRLPLNMKQTYMCRNEYNVTGLCARKSCPLASMIIFFVVVVKFFVFFVFVSLVIRCIFLDSRYATIIEKNGKKFYWLIESFLCTKRWQKFSTQTIGICYLYMKTIERAHSPKNLWERIKLKEVCFKKIDFIDVV